MLSVIMANWKHCCYCYIDYSQYDRYINKCPTNSGYSRCRQSCLKWDRIRPPNSHGWLKTIFRPQRGKMNQVKLLHASGILLMTNSRTNNSNRFSQFISWSSLIAIQSLFIYSRIEIASIAQANVHTLTISLLVLTILGCYSASAVRNILAFNLNLATGLWCMLLWEVAYLGYMVPHSL